jgi:hypothetical protein
MPMISSNLQGSLSALAMLALCSCASNPVPAPVAPGAAPTAAAAPARGAATTHLCGANAQYVTFASLGVPQAERPVDLVTTDDADYVLFAPARLVKLTREEGKVKLQTIVGDPGQSWQTMALDPIDNTLWVATGEFVLVHVSPSLHQQTVPLQRVAGSGGFVRLVVATDAIYAAPACASDAVWRIDRNGKVLAASFPLEADLSRPQDDFAQQCARVRLDRDPEGHVVAWDWHKKALFRVDDQGAWHDVNGGVFATLPDPRVLTGVDVGGGGEQWYFTGAAGLFLWKGRPVFLGQPTIHNIGTGADTVLLVPQGETARELIEACHGASIQRVATTPHRYAALLRGGIVLGDLAGAPDLQ